MLNFITIVFGASFSMFSMAQPAIELPVEAVPRLGFQVEIKFYDPPAWALCSCVNTAKYILGKQYSGSWGNAKDIPVDPFLKPEVGLIVKLNEGPGHIAVIISKTEDTITIDEGNYKPCQRTQRELRIDDPRILGYIAK